MIRSDFGNDSSAAYPAELWSHVIKQLGSFSHFFFSRCSYHSSTPESWAYYWSIPREVQAAKPHSRAARIFGPYCGPVCGCQYGLCHHYYPLDICFSVDTRKRWCQILAYSGAPKCQSSHHSTPLSKVRLETSADKVVRSKIFWQLWSILRLLAACTAQNVWRQPLLFSSKRPIQPYKSTRWYHQCH